MGEENKIRDAADAVKGVLETVPVYDDALQPAAQTFGQELTPAGAEAAKALVTTTRAINAALAPLRLFAWGMTQMEECILPWLVEKFKSREDKIVTPDIRIAVPSVEALRLAGSDPLLREMYLNLLATSMDADSVRKAHPAFVEFIRQMVRDEILILLWLRDPGSHWIDRGQIIEIAVAAKCSHCELMETYAANLTRLGLINIALIGAGTPPHLTGVGIQFLDACGPSEP